MLLIERLTKEQQQLKWDFWKKAQREMFSIPGHPACEARETTGHGESVAVIRCYLGSIPYRGVPREFC